MEIAARFCLQIRVLGVWSTAVNNVTVAYGPIQTHTGHEYAVLTCPRSAPKDQPVPGACEKCGTLTNWVVNALSLIHI